jgi:SAM-dependent methyltransferase
VTGARDPTGRFSDRVGAYVKARPAYPPGVFETLAREVGVSPGAVIVEPGAGTGILSAQLLERGYGVVAVEPNRGMAEAARESLGGRRGFRLVRGSAESTGLAGACADAWIAAQAFHWFDPEAAGAEARRVLRAPGPAVLLWNMRRLDSTPFLRGYESLLHRWSADYAQVAAQYMNPTAMRAFFRGDWRVARFDNHQSMDLETLEVRLRSTSYAPPEGHPSHAPMMAELRRLFDEHQREGVIQWEHDAEMFWATLH